MPNFIDNLPIIYENPLVIVINIWQKLSSIEREITLIVTHF